MTTIKYIKNPPAIEELETLYSSPVYQKLVTDFENATKLTFYHRGDDKTSLWNILSNVKRRYLMLNLPIEKVLSEFDRLKDDLLEFTIAQIEFFKEEDDDVDGEFPEGEEPGEENKSKVVEVPGISKTLFLDRFCELYFLNIGDKELFANFLKQTRMPYAKKYQGQLTKIYNQTFKK